MARSYGLVGAQPPDVLIVGRPLIMPAATQVVKLGEPSRAIQLGELPRKAILAPQQAVARSSFFTQRVKKEGRPLGIRVEYALEKCIVVALTSGAIPTWNEANPQQAIRPGDRIVQVNGQSLPGRDLAELLATAAGEVEIQFERPKQLKISMEAGVPLGMKVCEVLDGFGLTVAQLKDAGSAPKFNQANQVKVHVDDRVVEVDGQKGSSAELFELIGREFQEITVYTYS